MYAGVCMPLLQVRDCPDDVYQKITRVARREKRTIAQQVVVLLETSLGQEQSNLERRRKLMEKINQRTIPEGVRNVDAVKLIQEDRNR